MFAFILTNDKTKITMSIQGINTKLHWLCSIYTSPALTVMIWGVKLAPTEHATHSPRRTNYHSISNQDMGILILQQILNSQGFKQQKYTSKVIGKSMQKFSEI